ncbi:hypothetical protein [Hydrogenimonas sp.]
MNETKKKATFLAELLEVPMATAMVFAEMIADIPYARILEFGRFIVEGYEPKKSKMLVVKESVVNYRRLAREHAIKSGSMLFESREEMIRWVEKHYRGKELVSGPKPYKKFVVIGVGEDGRLVNRYALDDFGRFKPLDHESAMAVYAWLFANQHRIGSVEHIAAKELPMMEAKALAGNGAAVKIDKRVARMIGGAYARVDKI